jgi:hypothetical protein
MHSQPAKKNTHPRARDPPYTRTWDTHQHNSSRKKNQERPNKKKKTAQAKTNSIPKTGTKFVEEEEEEEGSPPSRRRGD